MAANLPRESAVVRSEEGWWVTPEVEFMREIEYRLQILAWQQTADGHKGANPPARIPLPGEQAPESDVVGADDGFDSIEEMDAWFAARRAA